MAMYKTSKDIDGGWAWLVLGASYGTLIVFGTSTFMSGVLYVAFLDTFNEGTAKTAAIGSLNMGLFALLGPFASSVINASSCRVSMVIGGFMCTVCYFVSSFLPTIDYFIVVLGVCAGVSNSLASIPAVVILAYYFQERRNLFISLSSVVIALGMFIASPFGLFLLETYGLRGTLMIMSGINAHICVFGMVCKPSSIELAIQRHQKEIQLTERSKRKPGKEYTNHVLIVRLRSILLRLRSALSIDLLSNLPFLLFSLSTMFWSLMLTICLQHLPNYLADKGASDADISAVMITFTLSHTFGRFLTTLIVSKGGLDFMTLHVGMSGIIGIVSIAFPFFSKFPDSEYVYACVVGLYTGGINTLLTPIALSLVEEGRISAAHGMSYSFSGIGMLLGPYLAGLLFGITRSYDTTFLTGGAVVILGCIFGMFAAAKSSNNCTEGGQTQNMTIDVSSNDTPLNNPTTEIIQTENQAEAHKITEEDCLV